MLDGVVDVRWGGLRVGDLLEDGVEGVGGRHYRWTRREKEREVGGRVLGVTRDVTVGSMGLDALSL